MDVVFFIFIIMVIAIAGMVYYDHYITKQTYRAKIGQWMNEALPQIGLLRVVKATHDNPLLIDYHQPIPNNASVMEVLFHYNAEDVFVHLVVYGTQLPSAVFQTDCNDFIVRFYDDRVVPLMHKAMESSGLEGLPSLRFQKVILRVSHEDRYTEIKNKELFANITRVKSCVAIPLCQLPTTA